MKENKFCQSCSMPLNLDGQDVRGTEKDGSLSAEYCSYCYQSGTFTEPTITYDQMLQKGRTAISAGKGSAFKKWLMKASYPMLLKKASRWN